MPPHIVKRDKGKAKEMYAEAPDQLLYIVKRDKGKAKKMYASALIDQVK